VRVILPNKMACFYGLLCRIQGYRTLRQQDISAEVSSYKSRSHQQQCRSNIVKCYKSNDSFDKVVTLSKERNFTKNSFDIVAVWQQSRCFDMLRQSRTLLRHCCWCGRGLRRIGSAAEVS